MRHTPFGLRLARGCAWCAGLALTLVFSASTPAQETAADAAPLARYIPGDDLVAYAEFAGLDAHAEAWKKTAAYKMLNETTLGAMLEDVGTQLVDQTLAKAPGRKLTGGEVVTLVKRALHSGFAFGMNVKKGEEQPSSVVLVLRGAARKDIRAPVSKTLLSFGGKSGKPKLAGKAGDRQVAIMPSDTRPEAWAWWAEKDDVVIALDKPDTADAVIDVIDGKKASAVDQPTRIELAKTDNGFLPVGLAFLDSAGVPAPKGAGETARAQLAGVQRIDYRWGFDGDALMTAWRLVAPGPRQGALALVDGPKFSLKALPPMTDGVEGFTAVSLDLPETYDRLMALAKTANPEATEKADQAVATLKSKYKIDLRKDVLAQLGPRIAYFVAPGKLAATSAAGSEKADAGAGGGIPNPLTMMLAAVEVPKFALVVEVKNATAFGKKLDELMIAVNKILRESVKATAAAAGNTGGEGDSAPAERKRGGGPGVPAPKFEMMAGKAKAYALVLPAEMGKLPAGVKPTIRVGEKFVAIGVNPAVAGQALEAKEGWKPSGEFTSALASTPEGLVLLNVSDPRGTMPQELASLPRSLQTAINSAIQTALSGGMPGAAGAQPGSPGGFPGSSLRPNSPPTIPPPQTSASSPPPGGSSFPGAPNGAAGFPGAPGGANGAPAMGIVLKVDPAKLPSADALKALLFPGYAALSVNDQEIRYVTREAFPNISFGGGTGSPGASMILGPALQKAREAATKQMAAQAKGNVTPPPATAGEKPK